ncbi:MAG: VIT domain-containing protein [Edaphobacter sp.]
MTLIRAFVASILLAAPVARAESGVLIPRDKQQPDPAILSLQEMSVAITIDNGDARVLITQIFANHTGKVEEGSYIIALPAGSTVSDFATWDGPVRIPAVILERRRAEQVYDQARLQAIDPGLLEAGERDGSDPKATPTFTAKIVPIPAYATKRLELEYHQSLSTFHLAQTFVLPLQPSVFQKQSAKHFTLRFELHSAHAFAGLQILSKTLPLKLTQQDAHTAVGTFEGTDVAFTEDFAATWKLSSAAADSLVVTTYRNSQPAQPSPGETSPAPTRQPEPGFFLAQTLLADGIPKPAQPTNPRNVILLFDNSLSMQWDKLERSYAALEKILLGLTPADHFNLLLFNQDIALFQPQPVAADPAAIQHALDYVRSSRLRGGTDIGKALTAGLAQCTQPNSSLILLTDGGSDRGASVLTGTIAANYTQQWKQSPQHPRTHVFAVGDDANLPLLNQLAHNDGVLESVLSSEPVEAKLATFLSRIATRPVAGLHLAVDPRAPIHTIYPLDSDVYAGSIASWVGDYTTPAKNVTFTAQASREGTPFNVHVKVDLPAEALTHPQLPRLWAQARVNALLDQIAREGETREAVDEIIRLSRRYKFVTPYTSFLAVPRSLLRPRIIRPGDPVLRIHTDPAITSVIALFPFGLTKSLRHIASEDSLKGQDSDRLWETRFLAPTDMKDGTYTVRLILRDAAGHTYSESKTFVIASTPPAVRVTLDHSRYHRGDIMFVRAKATATTRSLIARLQGDGANSGAYGLADLRWNPAALSSTGQLRIPDSLTPGTYTLSVTAEDIAHNIGSQEVKIEIIP